MFLDFYLKLIYTKIFLSCFIIAIFLGCGYSNQSERFATSSDGVKIGFETKGKGIPAIVFVHGWSNNRSIWDGQIAYFFKKYTVIGIDLPGFRKSGNNRKSWTMSAFGNDVVALINQLKLKEVVLVGFSMGGPVIIEAAKKLPGKIKGLILVETMQDIERKISDGEIAYIDSVYMDLVTNPKPEKLEGGFYKENKEASFARIKDMFAGASHIGWRASLYETAHWINEDCVESLKSIQCPVVSINTDTNPTNEEAFRKLVPSFKVSIISDAGHLVFWDKLDEFNAILEESIRNFNVASSH